MIKATDEQLTAKFRELLIPEGYYRCLEGTDPEWLVNRRVHVVHVHGGLYWHAFARVRVRGRIDDAIPMTLVADPIEKFDIGSGLDKTKVDES